MNSEIEKHQDLLRSLFLFQHCRLEVIGPLLSEAEIVSYSKGDTIYSKDAYRRSLGVLLKGRAKINKQTPKKGVLLNNLAPGGVFGVASLFNEDERYVSNITAVSRCTVMFIGEELLKKLFLADATVSVNYIAFLTQRIRFLNRKIDSFTGPSSRQKVAMYFMDAAADKGGEDQVCLPFKIKDLASALDIGRASLYRVFDVLQQEGAIERRGKTILITNKDILKNFL